MSGGDKRFIAGTFFGAFIVGVLSFIFWPSSPTVAAVQPYANKTGEVFMVRGDRWGVLFGTEDDMLDLMGDYGLTDCAKKKIYVRGNLNLSNQRDTMIHELLHAGTCDEGGRSHNLYYNSTSEASHEGIYRIADFMSTLLANNPGLNKYLGGN